MAKPELTPSTPSVDALLLANDVSPELKRRLAELQIQKLQREMELLEKQSLVNDIAIRKDEEERKKIEEKERQEARMREEGAKESLRKLRMDQMVQNNCLHVNPDDGKSNLVGIRHWDGNLTINCGTCGIIVSGTKAELVKRFGTLFPKQENIGGPLPPGSYTSSGFASN